MGFFAALILQPLEVVLSSLTSQQGQKVFRMTLCPRVIEEKFGEVAEWLKALPC